MTELVRIREEVARRAEAIADGAEWPCRKGCDECCRKLAAAPRVSEAEWREIAAALEAMDGAGAERVRRRIREAGGETRPVTCPLLDREAGACLVYGARPVACRAYGFYAERDGVLGCGRIAALAEESAQVVWGNHAALGERLRGLGREAALEEWLAAEGDRAR
ncbi:MAG: YkgJ family cysteine cluster protein [Acidobacteriota bacterium]|nr:YkgJ family cysteine cluster protein [Acidobacteriota bacterium]